MNSIIKISVVIATHNRDEYLKEAIISAINQTYSPEEVIISDNVPSNKTKALIEKISQQSQIKIKYIGHHMRGRSSISMNLAVSNSQGNYIAFLNDDDVWELNYLDKICELILSNEAKIIYTWFSDWYKDKKKPGKKLKKNLEIKDFLIKNPGCVISNLVVNKELFIGLGGFDEYIHPSNDKDFIIRALYFGYNYDVVEENLVNLRRHTGKRETDISSEFLIGMKKFFNKHYFIASPLVKIKFWFKYWLLYVKSKI